MWNDEERVLLCKEKLTGKPRENRLIGGCPPGNPLTFLTYSVYCYLIIGRNLRAFNIKDLRRKKCAE